MNILTELRFAARTFRAAPTFGLAAVLSLALGIGGAVAMLAAVEAALLRPLPWPEPQQLVAIHGVDADGARSPVSLDDVRDWAGGVDGLEAVAGYRTRSFAIRAAGDSESRVVDVGMVTAGLARTLGTRPVAGRFFSEREDRDDEDVVLLDRELARSLFGTPTAAIGRSVLLNDVPHAVVGVLDGELMLPMSGRVPRALVPISDELYGGSRSVRALQALGRIDPTVETAGVASRLRAHAARVGRDHAEVAAGHSVTLEPLHEALRGDVRAPLLLLTAAATLLLVIATANVAGLLLGRATARRDELAVRRALGARTRDLLPTFLAEAAVLGVAGALGGTLVAGLAMASLPTLLIVAGAPAGGLPAGVEAPALGASTAAAALSLGAVLATLLGTTSALALRRVSTHGDTGRPRRLLAEPDGGPTRRRWVVVAQLAVSLLLVLSAGLLLRSLDRLLHTDPGFDAAGVWRFGIGLPAARYDTEASMIHFHRRLATALEELPGVESAAVVAALPVGGRDFATSHQPAGAGRPRPDQDRAAINVVGPGYFETLDIPVRDGRTFSTEDDLAGVRAVVVSESFRERFPETGSVGAVLELSWRSELNPPGSEWHVVGVVGDVRHAGLDRPAAPTVYLNAGQFPLDGGSYVLRARSDAGLAAAVQEAVRELDPGLQRIELDTMQARIHDSVGDRRLALSVLGLFAMIALALTAIGVYAVVATEALRRRRELAIRKALGAGARQIATLVLRDGLSLGVAGAAAGWLAFLWVGDIVAHRLHGITPFDPLATAGAAAVLVGTTLLASAVPSLRAALAAPMKTIRES